MSKFKVYVAASSAEISRARAVIAGLRSVDVEVTCTWPDVVAQVGDANPRDASQVDRRSWSLNCLEEIDAADAVLFLVPHGAPTFGGGWECGYAWNTNKHLAFSGETTRSVFCSLGVEFDRDGAAIAHFGGMAEARSWKRTSLDDRFDGSDVTQPMRGLK